MKLFLLISVGALVVASSSVFAFQEDTLSHLNLLRDVRTRQDDQFYHLHRSMLDQLLNIVDTIVQQGLDAIDELRQKLENLFDSLLQKGQILAEQTIERVKLYLEEFKQNLASKVDHFSECTATVPQKLDQISAKCLENAQTCHDKFLAQVNIIHDNAKEQTDALVNKVGELKKLAKNCQAENSLFDKVKCVVHHMDDAFAVVSEVLSDTGKLLTDAIKETFSLTVTVSGCFVDVVRQSHDATDKLAEDVSNCLREEKARYDN